MQIRTKLATQVPDVHADRDFDLEAVVHNAVFYSPTFESFLKFMAGLLNSLSAMHPHGTPEYMIVIGQVLRILSQINNVTTLEMRCAVGCYRLLLADDLVLNGYLSGSDLLCTLALLDFLETEPPEGTVQNVLMHLAEQSHDRPPPGLGKLLLDQKSFMGSGQFATKRGCSCKLSKNRKSFLWQLAYVSGYSGLTLLLFLLAGCVLHSSKFLEKNSTT